MFICLLGSLKVVYERINVESNYKTYETVMELRDIKSIASVENRDYLDVAREFTDIGVNSICVFEDTIDSLKLNENFKISTRYDGLDLEINGTKYGLEYIKKGT